MKDYEVSQLGYYPGPYFCKTCGVKYSLYRNLVYHTRNECGRSYLCICGTKCKRKRSMIHHMKKQHPNETHRHNSMYTLVEETLMN